MKIFDQHMHTNFSYDSQELFENYLAAHPENDFVTTEHLDFDNPVSDYENDLLNYDAYSTKITELNETYPNKIYRGVEIGYVHDYLGQIQAYLVNKNFNVRLLSVHHDGRFDFMQDEVRTLSASQLVQQYFDLLIEALESPIDANVLAHFDYGFRKAAITPKEMQEYAGPRLNQIIKLIIKRQLTLELNTKSMYRYDDVALYEYMIDAYLQQGGRLFSVGSDAHAVKYYGSEFPQVYALLKQKGVKEIAVFKDDLQMVRI